MKFIKALSTAIVVIGFGLGLPASANAAPLAFSVPVVGPAVAVMLPASARCVSLVYDVNGNRTSRNSSTILSANSSWGASVYGCSRWG